MLARHYRYWIIAIGRTITVAIVTATALLMLMAPVRGQAASPPGTPPDMGQAAAAASPAGRVEGFDVTVPGLVRDTDALVRAVLLLLLLASILTWTVWVAKSIELARGQRRLAADLRILTGADSLHALPKLASDAGSVIVGAVRAEMARSGDLRRPVCAEGLKERVTVRLLSVEAALARRMSAGINIVASIGSTAPFVGLFGTVWGIMSSFIGIARLQTSNLTAVAPGIAEALLTTAAGLAAAIPAVLIYNGFTRSVSGYRTLLADASNAAACVLSLEIERLQVADANARAGADPGAGDARTAALEEAVGGV